MPDPGEELPLKGHPDILEDERDDRQHVPDHNIPGRCFHFDDMAQSDWSQCWNIPVIEGAYIGEKNVMILEIVKVRGARKTTKNFVNFEVYGAYGVKVVLMSFAMI